jgi:hypothetical protein
MNNLVIDLHKLRLDIYLLIQNNPNLTNDQYDYIGAILGLCRNLNNPESHFRAKIIITIHDSVNGNHLVEVKEFMELSINNVKLMDLRVNVINKFNSAKWPGHTITKISTILGKTSDLSNIHIIKLINEADFSTLYTLLDYLNSYVIR